MIPEFKIETNGTTFINEESVSLTLVRPENNIAFAVLNIDDYRSKNFEAVFDSLNTLDLSLRYQGADWTKVFSGIISTVRPQLSREGEILEASVWGKGWSLIKTHCNTSYGVEGKKSFSQPTDIWADIVNNYINKSFGGANTGYAITTTYISSITLPSVTFVESAYKSNFDLINILCDLRNSYTGQQSPIQKSVHWIVDPTGNLRIKTIGTSQTGWTDYWKGSQVASTLEVAKDMILYDFKKNIEEYANKIVLCSALRKPAYDYWTENHSGLWGHGVEGTLTDDNSVKIVGSYSLKSTINNGQTAHNIWYPSAANAGWDFTKIESPNNPPSIDFYVRRESLAANFQIWMETSVNNGYYVNLGDSIPNSDEWVHFSVPFGNYYSRREKTNVKWRELGSVYNWNNINRIRLAHTCTVGQTPSIWVDDLHFFSKIIREAYDSTAITANKEYQRVILNDTAIDDTFKATDDSGTAARLVYAELLRRKQTPIVGIIKIPGVPDILPGQLTHIHSNKKADGTFRIDKDFRIKEIRHTLSNTGFETILNLTDDLYNSHAFAAPTAYSLLAEYAGALGHAEAKNLKSSGIDIEIPRLSKNYPS